MSDRKPLSDYIWWALPSFLKRSPRDESIVGALCGILGDELDTILGAIYTPAVDETPASGFFLQFSVATATGDYLDRLARMRQIFREVDETDESLRVRVLAAYEIKQKGGTLPGMVDGLEAVGYEIEVSEPNTGTDKWARFVVTIISWDEVVLDQGVFFKTVRSMKPAHTRALIDSDLVAATWDDWEIGEDALLLDEGFLDEWQPTT